MTKEEIRVHSLMLEVPIDASQEKIDEAYRKKFEYYQRTGGRVWCCDIKGRYDLMIPFENSPVDKSWRILKTKVRCSGCAYFMLPVPSTSLCDDEQCLNLYQTKTSSMQEINNELQKTNLDPRTENWITYGFLDLFNIRLGGNCDCEHAPFTRQCNDAPSIQKAIWGHIVNCLKTRERVEQFKDEVLRIIEQAAQNNPSLPSTPNYWGSWTPPISSNNNSSSTSNHTTYSNFTNNSSTSNYNSADDSEEEHSSSYSSDSSNYSSTSSFSSVASADSNAPTASQDSESQTTNSSSNFSSQEENNSLTSEEKPNLNNNNPTSPNLPIKDKGKNIGLLVVFGGIILLSLILLFGYLVRKRKLSFGSFN